jgi:hypothetical protein
MQQEERVRIVNEIIKEIASRGRFFFAGQKGAAELFLRNGKVYYKSEYTGNNLCLSIPDYRRPKGWHHGGTLMALCRDFKDFIVTGEKTNHNNGYGGLYCPHWGYSENDMEAIQEKAKKLGYL